MKADNFYRWWAETVLGEVRLASALEDMEMARVVMIDPEREEDNMNPKLDIPEFDDRNYATTDDYPGEYDADGTPVYVKKTTTPAESYQRVIHDFKPGPMVTKDLRHAELRDEDDGARLDTPNAIRRRALKTALEIAAQIQVDVERSLDHLDIFDSSAPSRDLEARLRSATLEYAEELSEMLGRADRLSG
jgi:hypothetical protein